MSDPSPHHAIATLGFIGLGVMGEPMCGHLARRSGLPVMAFDLRPEPAQRLAADGVKPAASLAELAATATSSCCRCPTARRSPR